MVDLPEPTLTLFGTNNESRPPIDRNTEVAISGTGFPPGAAVTLSVSLGGMPTSHDLEADAEGAFGWGEAVKPPLMVNLVIGASATFSTDPTDPNAQLQVVEGRTTVKRLSGDDTRPP